MKYLIHVITLLTIVVILWIIKGEISHPVDCIITFISPLGALLVISYIVKNKKSESELTLLFITSAVYASAIISSHIYIFIINPSPYATIASFYYGLYALPFLIPIWIITRNKSNKPANKSG